MGTGVMGDRGDEGDDDAADGDECTRFCRLARRPVRVGVTTGSALGRTAGGIVDTTGGDGGTGTGTAATGVAVTIDAFDAFDDCGVCTGAGANGRGRGGDVVTGGSGLGDRDVAAAMGLTVLDLTGASSSSSSSSSSTSSVGSSTTGASVERRCPSMCNQEHAVSEC